MSFVNPVWDALHTYHRHFAIANGNACRYPMDVAPFVALAAPTREALEELAPLLAPEEAVWLIADACPPIKDLICINTLECLQMVLPGNVIRPPRKSEIVQLTNAHAPEMVALTDLAFPGFFRKRTCEMGAYYGVRVNGELIAMGGERLMMEGYAEISGICTHPEHRGKGLASELIWELAERHRSKGLRSFLHVTSTNSNAIRLYLTMGFQEVGKVTLHQLRKALDAASE